MKIRKEQLSHFEFLAYCLMPNHFHFLVKGRHNLDNRNSIKNIGVMLSSYTQAINKQEYRIGTLFQRRTKAKAINQETNYLYYCINYIHQNPFAAELVKKLEDWEYSSFKDFIGLRGCTFCNIELCKNILGIHNNEDFYKSSYQNINDRIITEFY